MWSYLTAEQRLERLEEELYVAQRAVRARLPDPIRAFVDTYYTCATRADGFAWEHAFAREVIACAEILSEADGSFLGPRAYCPLCGDGSSAPYSRGFAVPGGLARHVAGEGNTGRCDVAVTVLRHVRRHWAPRFREADAAAAAAEAAEREQRLATEPLYVVRAGGEPVLRSDGLRYNAEPRDDAGMAWAETRLADLGFPAVRDDRVTRYSRVVEGYVVYADPRHAGQITFEVAEPTPSPPPRRKRPPRTASFVIPDRWTRDLPVKFDALCRDALGSLMPPTRPVKRPASR